MADDREIFTVEDLMNAEKSVADCTGKTVLDLAAPDPQPPAVVADLRTKGRLPPPGTRELFLSCAAFRVLQPVEDGDE